jgi:hypothetical protein
MTSVLFFFAILIIIAILVMRARTMGKMNIPEIYSSGILNKGEELTEHFQGSYNGQNGIIVFTSKRFLFLQKASGWNSKGYNVIMFCSWRNVVSVSTTGSMKLNLNVNNNNEMGMYVFTCNKARHISGKIIENKNNLAEKAAIEGKTVIIEEANTDSAMEILQKRLARGEITIDEFHKLVTRT